MAVTRAIVSIISDRSNLIFAEHPSWMLTSIILRKTSVSHAKCISRLRAAPMHSSLLDSIVMHRVGTP